MEEQPLFWFLILTFEIQIQQYIKQKIFLAHTSTSLHYTVRMSNMRVYLSLHCILDNFNQIWKTFQSFQKVAAELEVNKSSRNT